jgi:hypothetical protein
MVMVRAGRDEVREIGRPTVVPPVEVVGLGEGHGGGADDAGPVLDREGESLFVGRQAPAATEVEGDRGDADALGQPDRAIGEAA